MNGVLPAPTPPTEAAAMGVYDAARHSARRVEELTSQHCRGWRVDVGGVAADLAIVVRTRPDLPVRARWRRRRVEGRDLPLKLWEDGQHTIEDIIEVRADLRESARRFAIAHEIGHVMLHRNLASLADQLDLEDHERFANAFAAELLLPRAWRADIAREFRAAEEPIALLRLADSIGVSARTVLRFARVDNWLRGLDRVWLDIRALENRHTKRDRRLRVYDAVLDRTRWFLPSNRSLTGLFGSDDCLVSSARAASVIDARIDISHRGDGHAATFVHRSVPARIAALHLRRARAAQGLEVIASVELHASRTC